MLKYLIVCPLVFIAGFIDAIAGGGGLITLPAYMIAGLPAHTAIATNKVSSSMGSTMATYRYAKMGYIPWKPALFCAVFSICGSYIGAELSLKVDETALKNLMLVLLPVTAVIVARGKAFDNETDPPFTAKTYVLCAIIAFAIGMYDGFYGPGTGTFLIIALTGIVGMKLTTANGITKVMNLSSNLSAVAVFLFNGQALIPLGLTAGLFSVAGNYLGTKMFSEKGSKIAKPVMIAVLIIFFIKVIYETI